MAKLVVNGHQSLNGDVQLSGDQQTIMAIQAAALLATQGTTIVDNVPATTNIDLMNRFLQTMNVMVDFDHQQKILRMDATRRIDPVKISGQALIAAGSTLSRCHAVWLVDNGVSDDYREEILNISSGLQQMGATVEKSAEGLKITTTRLIGQNVDLQSSGMITTFNMMMAATLAQGITVLNHPNQSPAVVELAKVLNKMGGRVHGAGTDTIRIQGVTFMHSTDYYALSDQEEAGVYLVLGAVTAGDILVHGALREHLRSVIRLLSEMGNTVITQRDGIRIIGTSLLLPTNEVDITQFQQLGEYLQMAILGLQMLANGQTIVKGFTTDQLGMLGCTITNEDRRMTYHNHQLKIEGPIKQHPTMISTTSPVMGLLALVNALAIDQRIVIDPAEVVSGSFANLMDQLISLGAKIDLSFD